MQSYPLCRLNMTDLIDRTVFICCLGGSTCKVEDVIKIGNKANVQSKLQCKEKHNRLCHFVWWFWLILVSISVTAGKHRTWYGSLCRQTTQPRSEVEILVSQTFFSVRLGLDPHQIMCILLFHCEWGGPVCS